MRAELAKSDVLEALRSRVDDKLRALTDSQRATQAGATHAEARSEHAKDTRATEASYLARGLADRVEALRSEAALLAGLELRPFGSAEPAAATALIEFEDEHGERGLAFLLPVAGGERLDVGGVAIRSVTPTSPLGRALLGRCAGDTVEVRKPGGTQELSIRSIV